MYLNNRKTNKIFFQKKLKITNLNKIKPKNLKTSITSTFVTNKIKF